MESGSRRNTWLACPCCGHIVARARTCDVQFKCKSCGHEFEVIIRSVTSMDAPPRSFVASERKVES